MTDADRLRVALDRLVTIDARDGVHFCCLDRSSVDASRDLRKMELLRAGIRTGIFCAIMNSGVEVGEAADFFSRLAKIDATGE